MKFSWPWVRDDQFLLYKRYNETLNSLIADDFKYFNDRIAGLTEERDVANEAHARVTDCLAAQVDGRAKAEKALADIEPLLAEALADVAILTARVSELTQERDALLAKRKAARK